MPGLPPPKTCAGRDAGTLRVKLDFNNMPFMEPSTTRAPRYGTCRRTRRLPPPSFLPASSTKSTRTRRVNNAPSPSAPPPSVSYRWNPLLLHRPIFWISFSRFDGNSFITSSLSPPKANSTAQTTKPSSWDACYDRVSTFRVKWVVKGGAPITKIVGNS